MGYWHCACCCCGASAGPPDALVEALAGLDATFVAWAGATGLNRAATAFFGDLPFAPQAVIPPWLIGVGLAAAVVASVAGAFYPALRAARASLTRALGEL